MDKVKNAVEMALLCAGGALPMSALKKLFPPGSGISGGAINAALAALAEEWRERALEIKQTAGGWQFATRAAYAEYLPRLAREKPPRLSRRLLEVLAVVAYRQPATRGDIERIRGVATSPQHLRFLEECGWIEAVGRRETPGRPMMFATTTAFLDDLGLKSLEELPPPDELESIEQNELLAQNPRSNAQNSEDESGIAEAADSPNAEAAGSEALQAAPDAEDGRDNADDESAVADESAGADESAVAEKSAAAGEWSLSQGAGSESDRPAERRNRAKPDNGAKADD